MRTHTTRPMHVGAKLDFQIPEWVKSELARCVIIFGRIEQKAIEIAWVLGNAELKARLKIARMPATENFENIIEAVEKVAGKEFAALKATFEDLAYDRNLIVHGCWVMVDDVRPWVVWHKFLEDDTSVIGEFFEKSRFDLFIRKANHLHEMLCKWHDMLESDLGTKTSALTSSPGREV